MGMATGKGVSALMRDNVGIRPVTVAMLNQSHGGISMGRAPDHVGFTLALV